MGCDDKKIMRAESRAHQKTGFNDAPIRRLIAPAHRGLRTTNELNYNTLSKGRGAKQTP